MHLPTFLRVIEMVLAAGLNWVIRLVHLDALLIHANTAPKHISWVYRKVFY